jgi:hypothetical protein
MNGRVFGTLSIGAPHWLGHMGRNLFIEFPFGTKTDEVGAPLLLAVFVSIRAGEGGVAAKPEKLEPGTVSLYDGMNEPKGSIRQVNITRPELRPQPDAVAREGKQGMKTVCREVAVTSSVLLAAVGRVLGGVNIEDQLPLALLQ